MRELLFPPLLQTGRAGSLLLSLVLVLLGTLATAAAAEFQVNTYTTYDQFAPAVAVDATGGFVVVWESKAEDDGYYGVFGRRYDSSGAAKGDEFHVNTYTKSRQGDPAVAADGAGNFVVVWSSYGQDGDSYGIFGQRYDSSGMPQGEEFSVNTYTTRRQGDPSVAADKAGNFVVVWTGYGKDDYSGVFGQRFDGSGGAQGPEFTVNTYTTRSQNAPAVAADGAGNFVVVWNSDGQDEDGYLGVFGQRYDSGGNAQGGEFQVNTSTIYYSSAGYFEPTPAVATDAPGNFIVVWNSNGYYSDYEFGVSGQRYDSAGNSQGGEFKVNTTPICSYGSLSYPGKPAVAADASSGFVVVWENYVEDSGYYGVLGRRYDNAGAAQGDEFQVNSSKLGFRNDADRYGAPAIGARGTGDFVVVWNDYERDGDGDGVFGAVLCGNGLLGPGEQCDDGNKVGGDGCDAACRVETCFTCEGEPSVCTPVTCLDDANPCTDDVCNSETGCVHPAKLDATPCDDGNLCTAGDVCSKGACQPGAPVICPDDANPCTYDVCDPATGTCKHPTKPDETPCSNGAGCEADSGDLCRSGQCTDADVCSRVEITDEQRVGSRRPRLEVTCWGETRKDFCKVQGFAAPALRTMYHTVLATERLPLRLTYSSQGSLATEVPITKGVRKRISPHTRRAKIKLELNRTGRKLLREAFKRGEALHVKVHVESKQAGKISKLDYLVRLVDKKQ